MAITSYCPFNFLWRVTVLSKGYPCLGKVVCPLPDSFQACENCSLLRWNLRGEIQIVEASRAHQAGVNKREIQFNQ
jgi:hypothetical protein